jgi:hypothetical protein
MKPPIKRVDLKAHNSIHPYLRVDRRVGMVDVGSSFVKFLHNGTDILELNEVHA